MQQSTFFRNFFFLNLLIIFCFKSTFACQGSIPTVCEAFGSAKLVFAGKVTKIEDDATEDSASVLIHFEISKVYKGKLGSNHIVKFHESDCSTTPKIGENYLVFIERDFLWAYDRILPLSYAKDDIKYIESLSEENPQFLIKGHLNIYPENLSGIKVLVRNGGYNYPLQLDKDSQFEFKTTNPGKYTLRMLFPFKASIEMGYFVSTFYMPDTFYIPKTPITYEETIAEVEFDFQPNGCVYAAYSIQQEEEKQ